MHRAAHYLTGLFPNNAKRPLVEAYVLTPGDASTVMAALPIDANNYYYSACLSVLDGLRAIDLGFYTWSTVKLYYSTFYAMRAILAWGNTAVFWPVEAPYHVNGVAGAIPKWIKGKGSHKSLMNCFRELRPRDPLLSQPIGVSQDGIEWLLVKREQANYHTPRFTEPDAPPHYEQMLDIGVRKAIVAYLEMPPNILTFDEDHAIASFPLAVLKATGAIAMSRGGAQFGPDEDAFLTKKCQERKGVLSPLLTFIKETLAPDS